MSGIRDIHNRLQKETVTRKWAVAKKQFGATSKK
jgi:hypothetical protein